MVRNRTRQNETKSFILLNINQKYFNPLPRDDDVYSKMFKKPVAAGADRAFENGPFPERPGASPRLSTTTIDAGRYGVEPHVRQFRFDEFDQGIWRAQNGKAAKP